ncbi:MAG: hypothetical protein V3T77_04525 [Planctomycetota bacterium]
MSSETATNHRSPYSSTPHIWTIVERFYSSRGIFMAQHDRYEDLVAQYVEREGKPRDQIRLGPEELSGLLNFKELERIRDSYLLPLKDACHALFRSNDTTDFLDRLVNDIFHEISILKEEHYNIRTYARDGRDRLDTEELEAILDEVHDMFPLKVHRMRHLFETACAHLEKLLPRYRDNVVLIRSLFLHRNGFVAQAYEEGLIRFYEIIYGPKLAFTGYQEVGDSFYRSGFYAQARECYLAGEEYLRGVPPSAKRRLDSSWKRNRDHFKRFARECQAHVESAEDS